MEEGYNDVDAPAHRVGRPPAGALRASSRSLSGPLAGGAKGPLQNWGSDPGGAPRRPLGGVAAPSRSSSGRPPGGPRTLPPVKTSPPSFVFILGPLCRRFSARHQARKFRRFRYTAVFALCVPHPPKFAAGIPPKGVGSFALVARAHHGSNVIKPIWQYLITARN